MPTQVKIIGNNPTGAMAWKNAANTVTVGSMSDAGAFILGPPTNAAVGAIFHTLNLDTTNSTTGSSMKVSSGVGGLRPGFLIDNTSQSAAGSMFTNSGGAGIACSNTLSFVSATYAQIADPTDMGNSTGVAVGTVDSSGQWKFSGKTTITNVLTLQSTDNATVRMILQSASSGAGATVSEWAASTADAFRVNNSGSSQLFGIGSGGGMSAGGPTLNVNHSVQNLSTSVDTLSVRNFSTSTSSDVLSTVAMVKGSTTNTAGNNRFCAFSINAGGTGSGFISTNGASAVAFFASSDRRLKKDITDLDGALDKIMAMRPVSYKWKADNSDAVGFIAQELVEVLPRVVVPTDDGEGEEMEEGAEPWSMTDSGFVPYLVSALQELKQEFDDYVATHP